MFGLTSDVVFPQIGLFTVLVMCLIYLLSKNSEWNKFYTLASGALVFGLGVGGYLEGIGIGEKSAFMSCQQFITEETSPTLI